ncbi:MAG: ferritin-like domain-containing protein [Polyangiales bacterium]
MDARHDLIVREIAARPEAQLTPSLWEGATVEHEPHVLEWLRRSWRARAQGERRAGDFDRRYHALCVAARLRSETCDAVARIARDEERHDELCSRVADALGAEPRVAPPPFGHVLPDPSASASLAELARWTIVRFCVGEACAIQQLVAMRDAVEEAKLRPALTYMLRDEVHHARFGWTLAEELVPQLGRDELEWIGAALAHTFAFYESLHAIEDVSPGADEATNVRAFYAAIERDVLPGLVRLGIPAREAWELRAEARALW